MFAGMMSFDHNNGFTEKLDLKPEDINITPKTKPTPKGCKRYYFNKDGGCNKEESTMYFDALNKNNALKKFNMKKLLFILIIGCLLTSCMVSKNPNLKQYSCITWKK